MEEFEKLLNTNHSRKGSSLAQPENIIEKEKRRRHSTLDEPSLILVKSENLKKQLGHHMKPGKSPTYYVFNDANIIGQRKVNQFLF